MAPSTIAAIESGQTKDVMLKTLCRLCGVLLVTPDYLLGIYADETFADQAPESDARRTTVRESRICERCGRPLRRGEPHPPGECIMYSDERAGSTCAHREYLAALFGFGVVSIEAILADEYERRSRGRAPTAGC